MKKLNRIKVALKECKTTGVWLSEQLGNDPSTVSRWCNNHQQPSIETLERISELLDVNMQELLVKTK